MSKKTTGNSGKWAILLILLVGLAGLALACGQKTDQQAANNDDGTQVAANEPPASNEPPPSSEPPENAPAEPPAHQPAPSRETPRSTAPAPAPVPSRPATLAVTVPEATSLKVKLEQGLNSGTNQTGDTFQATLLAPVIVGDRVVLPEGSSIEGTLTDVVPAHKGMKESGGAMTLSFDRITTPSGSSASMAASYSKQAKSTGKKAGTIGGAAAGGALLGKVLGGGSKDAAVGAVVGGAIGTGVAANTKGSELKLEPGTELTITLEKPITLQMKR
jgi:hypothetical protein